MSPKLAGVTDSILVLCAITVAFILVRREFWSGVQTRPTKPIQIETAGVIGPGHREGPSSAKVQIVEFSDFQCPYCALVQGSLRRLRRDFPADVAIDFHHFPLSTLHPAAVGAALASECAADQGKFPEYNERLFTGQAFIGIRTWDEFAEEAGVGDLSKFGDCVARHLKLDKVDADLQAAKQLGLSGTPSIIVNGLLLPGSDTAILIEMVHKLVGPR